MTDYRLTKLIQMQEKIIIKVEAGKMQVQEGAELLGVTRQGLLKLRKQYRRHGQKALFGLKRGPKRWHRPWNRTEEATEEFVADFRRENPPDGPITISWKLADEYGIELIKNYNHCSTNSLNSNTFFLSLGSKSKGSMSLAKSSKFNEAVFSSKYFFKSFSLSTAIFFFK